MTVELNAVHPIGVTKRVLPNMNHVFVHVEKRTEYFFGGCCFGNFAIREIKLPNIEGIDVMFGTFSLNHQHFMLGFIARIGFVLHALDIDSARTEIHG